MVFNIAINVKIKNNNNLSSTENLLCDIASNLNAINIYFDYELEGINKYTKKNNSILIIDFENINELYIFINNIRSIKILNNISIDYIYYNNNILYASTKYLNSIKYNLVSKNELNEKININKQNNNFKMLYTLL